MKRTRTPGNRLHPAAVRGRPRAVATLVVHLAALLPAGTALAEDTADLESLLNENVITTASTTAQRASSAPATSVTLTAEDLQHYGLRSLSEAIDFLSLGVMTSDPLRTPHIGARGVILAGDDGKHFLLLVNGHALNDPLWGAARFDQGAGIPIDVIDHIEVILGPGSVLYGSNAMLGVINVITKSGSAYQGGHVLGEIEPGRTWRAGAGAGLVFQLFDRPAELTSSVEYFSRFGPDLEFDEHRFTVGGVRFRRGGPANSTWGGTVRNAYFTEAPAGVLRFRAGNLDVMLLASAYRRGIPYTTGPIDVDFDDEHSYELDRSLRLDVKYDATLSRLVQLTSRLYGDYFDYQARLNRDADITCFRSDFETCQYYDASRATWAGLEERLSFDWLSDASLVTMLGVDGRLRWVGAKEDALDFDTGNAFAPTSGRLDESAGLLSPYVQQTWSPAAWLDVNAGARLDAEERFSPIVSPRGAVALIPFEKTVFKMIYSQAFRAPTWIETDWSNYHQVRSNIDPETVRSVEGSIEQGFGAQRLLFGVFVTHWANLVEARSVPTAELARLQALGVVPITSSNLLQYHNVSTVDNYGWNGALSGTLGKGRLQYGVNATAAYTRRHTEVTTEPLALAPRLFGNARVAYAFGGFAPTPALAVRYLGPRAVDRATSAGYEDEPYATALAELRATLSGIVPGVRGLGYRLSALYATAADGPYLAGPALVGSQSRARTPIDRFRAFVGLRYDFAGSRAVSGGEP